MPGPEPVSIDSIRSIVCRCRPIDVPGEWLLATNPWTAIAGRIAGQVERLVVVLGGPCSTCGTIVCPTPARPPMVDEGRRSLPGSCEPTVEVLGVPQPSPRPADRRPMIVVDGPPVDRPPPGRRRLRAGGRIPKGFATIAHVEGRYDYVQQDGRWLLVDLEEQRVLDGEMDDEQEEREIVDRMNRVDAVCREASEIARQAGSRLPRRAVGARTKVPGGRM